MTLSADAVGWGDEGTPTLSGGGNFRGRSVFTTDGIGFGRRTGPDKMRNFSTLGFTSFTPTYDAGEGQEMRIVR